ncbi:MAG: HNH endonuclease, partial [Planctomycetes bacterium]|nr:HNH endonuclease [Planctomycetota bacterium]
MQASVLALNRQYAPVHILSVRRSFCLLAKALAEVISIEDGTWCSYDFDGWREHSEMKSELGGREDDEDWIRSVNFEIQVPRVIRLLYYDRLPRLAVKFSRRNVFLRDE